MRKNRKLVLTAAVSAALLFGANTVGYASVDNHYSIDIGVDATVTNSSGNSIAIGPSVTVDGEDSIAIGAAWESQGNGYERTTVLGGKALQSVVQVR